MPMAMDGAWGTQVIDVCRSANTRLVIRRARFSALVARELHHAMANLVQPNALDSAAVGAGVQGCRGQHIPGP